MYGYENKWRKGNWAVIRVYEFLLRPTSGQKRDIHALRKMARDLTNAAISERREAWLTTDFAHHMITGRDGERRSVYRHVGKGTSISYVAQSGQLKEIRSADPDGFGRWSFSTQQQVMRRVNKSYQAFFRRVKAGETPGYPRFKPLNRVTSVDMINGGSEMGVNPKRPVTGIRARCRAY